MSKCGGILSTAEIIGCLVVCLVYPMIIGGLLDLWLIHLNDFKMLSISCHSELGCNEYSSCHPVKTLKHFWVVLSSAQCLIHDALAHAYAYTHTYLGEPWLVFGNCDAYSWMFTICEHLNQCVMCCQQTGDSRVILTGDRFRMCEMAFFYDYRRVLDETAQDILVSHFLP